MGSDLESAVESLYAEIERLNKRILEIKKNINSLSVLMDKPQPFTDTEISTLTFGSSGGIKSDQFFGKGLSTSVKEYLKIKNSAATAREIFDALKAGGFEFDSNLAENIQYRGMTISISKNSKDFVYIKSNNSYGLWEFYPEKVREKKKIKTNKNNLPEIYDNKETQDENGKGN